MLSKNWKEDPRLSQMNPEKLKYLSDFAEKVSVLPKEQLLPAFLSLQMDTARSQIAFSDQETELLISILSEKMSPEDRKKMELLRGVAQKLARRPGNR